MPPSPCPIDPTHPVEWDRTIIDRCVCMAPGCGVVFPFEPAPEPTRQPYKDGPDFDPPPQVEDPPG